jgi:F1F0 ATPase subunit 2
MMNNLLLLIPALATGMLLGIIFFGGLWWTVQKGLVSAHPALWFLSSLLLRTAITVTGFYLISAGNWQKLLACLLGFILVRLVMMYFLPFAKPIENNLENPDAP